MERRNGKLKQDLFYLLPFGGLETTTPRVIQSATPITQKNKPVTNEKINGSCHHPFTRSAGKVMLEHHDSCELPPQNVHRKSCSQALLQYSGLKKEGREHS